MMNYNLTGDLTQRLCTAAEIKFYFSSLFAKGTKTTNYVKPNKNCNLTSWVSGCEPGWGCYADQYVELKNSTYMPARSQNCGPCCEGFFCPRGLACMIRKYLITLSVTIFFTQIFGILILLLRMWAVDCFLFSLLV